MRVLLVIALVACQPRTRVVLMPVACDSRAARPAIACASGRLGYDGCRWACALEPVEMGPMRVQLNVGGYEAKE
jgi:hypothetical protein